MSGARPVPLSQLLELVAETAPPDLAEPWDRVGLMVGAADWPVGRVLVGLELTADLLDRAGRLGVDLILVHHPPLFKPLTALDPGRPESALALRAYDERRAVIAAHTNLDAARGGVNDALADRLGLINTRALRPASGSAWRKLVAFVPAGYQDRVYEAVVAAGAGRIGDYTGCSWRSAGEGTFRPGEFSRPFIGARSILTRAAEFRLEVLVPAYRLGPVTAALAAAHPYEEPAFDVYPLEMTGAPEGMGRVGDLSPPVPFDDFIELVKDRLGAPMIQVANARDAIVERAAVCGGSGADLIGDAKAGGADVFVTGEAGHHAARDLEGTDLGLLVVGHFYSERPVVPAWTRNLAAGAGQRGWSLEFVGDDDQSPAFAFR